MLTSEAERRDGEHHPALDRLRARRAGAAASMTIQAATTKSARPLTKAAITESRSKP